MSARHRRCPRPDKVTYPSQWQATHAVRRSPFLVRAYKCRDHWHTTSKPRG